MGKGLKNGGRTAKISERSAEGRTHLCGRQKPFKLKEKKNSDVQGIERISAREKEKVRDPRRLEGKNWFSVAAKKRGGKGK